VKYSKRTFHSSHSQFSLPRINVTFPFRIPQSRVLLVAGGEPPDKEWMLSLEKDLEVWAVDKGLDLLREFGIIPSRIIGDLDSADPDAISWALERNIPIERHDPEKDLTDLQLSLWRVKEKFPLCSVVVTACWGNRFDHTLSTLLSCLWGYELGIQPVCLSDGKESFFFLSSSQKGLFFPKIRPKNISLFALSEECRGVSISGTHWELSEADLSMYKAYAVSNRMNQSEECIRIEVGSGWLGIYFQW